MILVTGSAGKTGRAVVNALAAQGEGVRALVRTPDQASQLIELGAAETFVGDMCSRHDMSNVMAGVRAVYLICPNVNPHELQMAQHAILAATESRVERFVYHSVLHPQVEIMPNHWQKMRVEERLFESALNFTILQPAAYMQNILAAWKTVMERGIYEVPYSIEARLSIVDLPDIAEAAAIVLTQPGHDWAIYELGGPEPLSQVEVAGVLASELGRPVEARQLNFADWRKRLASTGLGAYEMQSLIAMFEYYDLYGFKGNSTVLQSILGRPPSDFLSFVRRTIDDPGH